MDLLDFLLILGVATAVALLLGRLRAPRELPDEADADRVSELCVRLTGDPARDRPVQNRILSLGAGVVPALIEALAETLREPDGVDVARLARLEEVLADFGLAAVGPIATRSLRIQPTTPLGTSLVRVLRRLGAPGAVAFLREGLSHPELAPFLPRWRLADPGFDPGEVLLAVLRGRPVDRRRADLDALAGLLVEHPRVVSALWERSDAAGRTVVLEWLADWRPLATVEHARAGLADESPEVRTAAAALAALLDDESLLPRLATLSRDGVTACRHAAVTALGAIHGGEPTLEAAAGDPDPDVALHAVLASLGRGPAAGARALARAPALTGDPRAELLRPAFATPPGELDPGALLAALEADDPAPREVAVAALGAFALHDPRARERLILLADAQDRRDRLAAVVALAQANDAMAADLSARAVRDPLGRPEQLRLALALRHLGPAALVPLARRVRSESGERVDTLLALVRCQPYASAVAPLLRALEGVRAGEVEGAVGATLHAGGPDVRAALLDGLLQPGRGLLTPALRYLAAYATPDDLPLLMDLFDRHPPLRGVLLNLIEAQGEAAEDLLAERVRRGGDDAVLLTLEQRLKVLRACAPRPPAPLADA